MSTPNDNPGPQASPVTQAGPATTPPPDAAPKAPPTPDAHPAATRRFWHRRPDRAPGNVPSTPPGEPTKSIHWGILAGIAVLALALRLREALSSPYLAADEPFAHMARTWDLLQGQGVNDHPPGLMVLLAPFAILGQEAFHFAARFLPAFLGAGGVVALFFLARPYAHPIGALAASLALAVMPEHIMRTNLLMPSTVDLAVLPIVFLAALRMNQGLRWPTPTLVSLLVLLLFVHPAVLGLVLPAFAIFWLVQVMLQREARSWSATAGGASAATFSLVLLLAPGPGFAARLFDTALPRLGELLMNPASIFPLPQYVDLGGQIGFTIMVLGAAGGVLAVVRRDRLGLLALVWTALLLPVTLVDWFGVGYIPHRAVVFLGLGFALLVALPVTELVRVLHASSAPNRHRVTWATVAVVALLLVPAATAVNPWYRSYEDSDYEAYEELDAQGADYVVAGSWHLRTGYRAVTGNHVIYYPQFFSDERVRSLQLDEHPDLVVVVDDRTEAEGNPTDFLASWNLIGQWGDVRAYQKN